MKQRIYFLALLAAYLLTPRLLLTPDTILSTTFVLHLLETGQISYRDFVGISQEVSGMDTDMLACTPSGKYMFIYPVGVALLTAPLYFFYWLALQALSIPIEFDQTSFATLRLFGEKVAAALIGAISLVIFFRIVRSRVSRPYAVLGTLALGFASPFWSVAAINLFQHGAVMLVLLFALRMLERSNSSEETYQKYACLCAISCGFLPVIRPTALLFSIPIFAFLILQNSTRYKQFFSLFALGLAPGLIWNIYFFHSPLGGYAAFSEYLLTTELNQILANFSGLLLHPLRGIIVFCPVVLLCPLSFCYGQPIGRATVYHFLLLSSLILLLYYSSNPYWHGGFAHGPRYLAETLPIFFYFLTLVFARYQILERVSAASIVVSCALLFSFALQLTVVFGVGFGIFDGEELQRRIYNFGELPNDIPSAKDVFPVSACSA